MKRPLFRIRPSGNREAGLTLIEVMFAGAVLVAGFMGLFGLFLTAIASNNRNKLDSTSTMLAQAIVENINSVLTRPGINLASCSGNNCLDTFSDCTGTVHTMTTATGGVALNGTQIDFTQTNPPALYQMDYVVCDANTQSTYDVRWNIQTVTGSSNLGSTYLVTVGVRKKGQGSGGNLYFALPVNLRTYVAN
jgi:Tfp pilus assembly protein PilV